MLVQALQVLKDFSTWYPTHVAFTEMKNLMVIRGENPLQCFDQEHLIEQWASRKSEVDTMLNAISRKPDHLQGVNVEELTKKAPEEQGLLLLKPLLKHVDSDPNIQMLAYLKQHNFLKRVEPHTPHGSSHSPEGSNTPVRSNTPTTFTDTDPAIETLERTSIEPDNRSDAESSPPDSGIQSDLKGNDNDDAA